MKDEEKDQLIVDGISFDKVDLREIAVDKQAYDDYVRLMNNPILNHNRRVEASDGTMIDLSWFSHTMSERIEHLPEKEQRNILAKKRAHGKVQAKCAVKKRKAFNLHRGGSLTKMGVKLLECKKKELLELFGRMFDPKEVHEIVVEEWEIPIKIEHLYEFRKSYNSIIEKKVELYKSSHTDIRLGVKRSRLEEYCWIFNTAKKKYRQTESREDLKVLVLVLEKIKGEVEVDKLMIEGGLQIDMSVEVAVNNHMAKEVMKGMVLRQIIIGRVAARMSTRPADIITRLTNSYYNKFFTGEIEDIDYEDVIYPVDEPYDFDNIQQINAEITEEAVEKRKKEKKKQLKAIEDVKEAGIKDKLLELINAEKGEVEKATNDVKAARISNEFKKVRENKMINLSSYKRPEKEKDDE